MFPSNAESEGGKACPAAQGASHVALEYRKVTLVECTPIYPSAVARSRVPSLDLDKNPLSYPKLSPGLQAEIDEMESKAALSVNITRAGEHGQKVGFQCIVCPKTFTRRTLLRDHMRSHALQHRRRIHTTQPPFVCKVCDREFEIMTKLRLHALIYCHGWPSANSQSANKSSVHEISRLHKHMLSLRAVCLMMCFVHKLLSARRTREENEQALPPQILDRPKAKSQKKVSNGSFIASPQERAKRKRNGLPTLSTLPVSPESSSTALQALDVMSNFQGALVEDDCDSQDRTNYQLATSSSEAQPPSLESSDFTEGEMSFIGDFNTPLEPSGRGMSEFDGAVQNFIAELAERIVARCVRTNFSHNTRGGDSFHPATSGSSSPVTSNITVPTSPDKSTKRNHRNSRDESDPNEDEDEDEGGVRKRKRTCRRRGSLQKLFACPFSKFDPERYSERNTREKHYRRCGSVHLNAINRVKQHLYRTHARPLWYCGNCYLTYKNRENLHEHQRQRPPCEAGEPQFEEMMTDQQYSEVKRRTQGPTGYDSWYFIFNILFPRAERPISPYASRCDPSVVRHFVEFFRAFGPVEFFNLMRDRHERGQSLHYDVGTQAIVDEAFEIALPDFHARIGRVFSRQQSQETRAPENLTLTHDEVNLDIVESMPMGGNIPGRGQNIPDQNLPHATTEATQSKLDQTLNDSVSNDFIFDASDVYNAFDNYADPSPASMDFGEQWPPTQFQTNEDYTWDNL